MELRSLVQEKLKQIYSTIEVVSNLPVIWKLNGHLANVRTANEKAGAKFWFDVTPDLYEQRKVDFFLYCCSDDAIYVFPRVNLEFFMSGANLGGQKQVPNFTIYIDDDALEPAGHSNQRMSIHGFREAYYLIPGGRATKG